MPQIIEEKEGKNISWKMKTDQLHFLWKRIKKIFDYTCTMYIVHCSLHCTVQCTKLFTVQQQSPSVNTALKKTIICSMT